MDQKQRDKIAWTTTILLVPVFIYLMAGNIFKLKKLPPPPPPPVPALPADALPLPAAGAPESFAAAQRAPAAPLNQKIMDEQKRIAAAVPKNNPFSEARNAEAESHADKETPAALPEPEKIDLRLTAIVSRQDSGRRMAMINGRFVGEGDRIAGWTIVRISPYDVLLRNGPRQMVIKLR